MQKMSKTVTLLNTKKNQSAKNSIVLRRNDVPLSSTILAQESIVDPASTVRSTKIAVNSAIPAVRGREKKENPMARPYLVALETLLEAPAVMVIHHLLMESPTCRIPGLCSSRSNILARILNREHGVCNL